MASRSWSLYVTAVHLDALGHGETTTQHLSKRRLAKARLTQHQSDCVWLEFHRDVYEDLLVYHVPLGGHKGLLEHIDSRWQLLRGVFIHHSDLCNSSLGSP